jgi:transglutaminase-like putative cysteine protease
MTLAVSAAAPHAALADPTATGASAAWTSDDPIIRRAVALVRDGKFADAASLLAAEQSRLDSDAAVARDELVEVIRRTRREYSQDAAAVLKEVKKLIPDATAGDIDRWRATGALQHRTIDGQAWFFRREPGNLFRFDAEAKRRRDQHARPKEAAEPQAKKFDLVQHLTDVAAAADANPDGGPEVLPVHHRMRYVVTVVPNRAGAKAGSLVRAWLPFPQVYRQQRDVKMVRTSPPDALVAPPGNADDPSDGAPQRSVYLQQRVADPAQPVRFELEFEYAISAYYPRLSDADARPLPTGARADALRPFLVERPPHVAFTPEVMKTVADVVADETNPLARARRIFHFVDERIPWCAEEEYSVIPSLSAHGLSRGRGDCGVQGTVFITMCRAAGIPARWQSGWQTRPGQVNLHDWAEFYVEPWGWLPADASYGVQRASDDPRVRDFYLGHLDAYRLIVNLDYGRPLHPPKGSFRSEPLDFQRGEIELDGRNLYFDEWSYDMDIEWAPLMTTQPASDPSGPNGGGRSEARGRSGSRRG